MNNKVYLNKTVLEASQERISYLFDKFDRICLSFSAGKDSSVLFHLVMNEAKKRNRKIGVLFIDWEIQYQLTINHLIKMTELYKDNIEFYWVQLPLLTVNSCSFLVPEYRCWDPEKKNLWVRQQDSRAVTDFKYFDFYYPTIKFEEFVPMFLKWYAKGQSCANLVGIRAQESLKRLMAVSFGGHKKIFYENRGWISQLDKDIWSCYPLYDWQVEDIWRYNGKTGKIYPPIYDYFYKAGLKLSQMRVDEAFSDEARKSLWLYSIIEPQTWAKASLRVTGANSGALMCKEQGSVLGNGEIELPKGYNWERFADFLLQTMPRPVAEHYKNKIAVYIKWFQDKRGIFKIEDFATKQEESKGSVPSWRSICKTILKNDYYCTYLGFSPTKSSTYQKYMETMKKKRNNWGIYAETKT